MSVTIRLTRTGKKFAPSYKIIVANTRNKRDGMCLDTLGHYNPSVKPAVYDLDVEKYNKWVKEGAIVSAAVKSIKEGTYKTLEYNPKKAKKLADKAKAAAAAQA